MWKKTILLMCALVLCSCVYVAVFAGKAPLLRVHFLDVGQGDAILIETPAGHRLLIDGGPDKSVLEGLGAIIPLFDKRIDLMILTHPHADHLNGLPAVLDAYMVKAVMLTGVHSNNLAFARLREKIEKQKIKVIFADASDDFAVDGVFFDVLYPFKDIHGEKLENANNGSVVMMLDYGECEMLFTGDAEEEVESELLHAGVALDADVLKVGHHGSLTSSSEAFLRAVTPDVAVISVGEGNSYGHPKLAVLQRLVAFGSQVLRTDLLGSVEITCDGQQVRVVER